MYRNVGQPIPQPVSSGCIADMTVGWSEDLYEAIN